MTQNKESLDAQALFSQDIDQVDAEMMRALIVSPVYESLKRVVGKYKKECEGILLNAREPYHIHRTQGIILGVSVLENMPGILLRQELRKQEQKKKEEEMKKRTQRPEVKSEPGKKP